MYGEWWAQWYCRQSARVEQAVQWGSGGWAGHGGHSWPALSDAARASSYKSSSDYLKGLSDGSSSVSGYQSGVVDQAGVLILIKRCRGYNSALVLHSEAQALQYQQKVPFQITGLIFHVTIFLFCVLKRVSCCFPSMTSISFSTWTSYCIEKK
ncbi:hypothetical protein CFOL_v3_23886 [Cephalotus follicularis]|uniref:Uncharacterized protein n=1 Tax=Cephalotus follicularis TaxID=3775 RepID=A0A1Q3CJN6_CEPFO|nr:hypothetical protein CFOL_v3_23886 [Cephalotus follicularis]